MRTYQAISSPSTSPGRPPPCCHAPVSPNPHPARWRTKIASVVGAGSDSGRAEGRARSENSGGKAAQRKLFTHALTRTHTHSYVPRMCLFLRCCCCSRMSAGLSFHSSSLSLQHTRTRTHAHTHTHTHIHAVFAEKDAKRGKENSSSWLPRRGRVLAGRSRVRVRLFVLNVKRSKTKTCFALIFPSGDSPPPLDRQRWFCFLFWHRGHAITRPLRVWRLRIHPLLTLLLLSLPLLVLKDDLQAVGHHRSFAVDHQYQPPPEFRRKKTDQKTLFLTG